MNTIPKAQLILGYKEFFNVPPPGDRVSLVAGICKRNLIAELAGLNYRLKPNTSKYYDTSLENQIKELEYFCGIDENLYKKYSKIAASYTLDKTNYPLIFTRQTCLFALEEIIQSKLQVIDDFTMARVEVWDSLFRYILAVNTTITAIQEEEDANEPVNFENLNPKLLPLNELSLNADPFQIPFRGYKLMEYLFNHDDTKEHLVNYLQITYSASFDYFVYETMGAYLANKHENSSFNFAYNVEPQSTAFFEILSQKYVTTEIPKLLSIRKFPFYKSRECSYLLTDNILLLEKLYTQFINDFWFDYLKPTSGWNIKKYKSIIGYFLESYVREITQYSFSNAKYYVIRQFNELKTTWKGNQIEVADLYIRYNSKVILGQVKSTTLYDTEKYGGNLDLFYKNNRNNFFDSFGVNQLVQSIKVLNDTMLDIDSKFPHNKSLQIFPIIVFSEKSLQTPLMAEIFQKRFAELLKDFQSSKIYVHPISLIHISDLESIQDHLYDEPSKIWEILKYHCRSPKFMPPFYNSINRLDIRPSHKRTMSLYEILIPRFSGEHIGS